MNKKPLDGRRVVITRAASQARKLRGAFEAAGARVALLPLIEVVPPEDPSRLEAAARDAAEQDWWIFTSANAVRAFLPLVELPLPRRPRIAVVGPATADALARFDLEPTVEAGVPNAEGLLATLTPRIATGDRVLIPRAADANDLLSRRLTEDGAEVTAVVAYDKRLPAAAVDEATRLFSASRIGMTTVTSPRIARHLASLFATDWPRRRTELEAISIGPVTSAELRRLGVEPAAEATRPTDEGLVVAAVRIIRG